MSNPTPLVSVAIITHNHERFVTKAIESALAQRTNFPIELVIGDDASSDDTGRRIEVVRAQAPGIIRTLGRPTNIGMHRNLEGVLEECRAEFVAFLEGDDYWTSVNKLQLQSDILRARRSIVAVFHPAAVVDVFGKETKEMMPGVTLTEIGTQELLESNNFIPTASVMIRRSALAPLPEDYRKLNMRDWPMWVFSSLHGRWLCLPTPMAAYRVHDGGSWTSLSYAARLDAIIEALRMFAVDLPRPLAEVARRQLARMHLDALRYALASGGHKNARRELREVAHLLSYYRVTDARRVGSAFLQSMSPRTHSVAKRVLCLIRARKLHAQDLT
jgi:glycosyltransferase involved in cell wall biosynthesis